MQMLYLIDGNNQFRRQFETRGPTAMPDLFYESISNDPNLTIAWVWDGINAKDRRKVIHPDYKGNRPPTPEEFYKTMQEFRMLLTHSSCVQVCCDTWEADDVIATLAKNWSGPVRIQSTDMDFLSLVDNRVRMQSETKQPCAPKDVQLYKTLVGDKSDNLPGLHGFGEKRFDALDKAQKEVLSVFLGCGGFGYPPEQLAEACGFTPALIKRFAADYQLLRTYWQVVQLYDVPERDLRRGLVGGELDVEQAKARLRYLKLPTESKALTV